MPTITFTAAWQATLVRAATDTLPALYSGIVTVTGTTNYGADSILLTNVVEVVTITFPNGMSTTITINPNVSRSGALTLPSTTTGTVMEGAYELVMVSTVSGPTLPGTYTSAQTDFDFCISPVYPTLVSSVDCVCAQATFTDETNYTGATLVSRTLTLTPPVYTGIWSPISTSTQGSISNGGLDLYKGVYTCVMVLVVTKDGVTYNYTIRQTVTVDCKSICEMFCALETLDAKIQANTTNPAEKAKQLDAFVLATALAVNANQSQSCNSSALAGYQTSFWSVLSPWIKSTDCCDCCSDGDIIQARCGVNATPASYTFTAQPSQYLAVTVNGTAVEYSLTSAAVALLDQVRTTTVTSTDGSVTVTPTLSVSPGGTNNYNLSVSVPSSISFVITKVAGVAPAISDITEYGSIFANTVQADTPIFSGQRYWIRVYNFLAGAATQYKVTAQLTWQNPAPGFELVTGTLLQNKLLLDTVVDTASATSEFYLGFSLRDSIVGAWGLGWSTITSIEKQVDEYRITVKIEA